MKCLELNDVRLAAAD